MMIWIGINKYGFVLMNYIWSYLDPFVADKTRISFVADKTRIADKTQWQVYKA
jgi:hypothetical protein